MKQRHAFNVAYLHGLLLAVAAGFGIYRVWGEAKPFHTISWLDVFSEGGMTLLALFWLVLLLRSRPGGRVTQLLALGLSCVAFSWCMDTVDEFYRLPDHLFWRGWLESLPVPMALGLLSLGIFHWHKEEIAISAQLTKRERLFRDHRLFDKLIPVGGASYLREQIRLTSQGSDDRSLALVAVDIDNFNHINRQHGFAEGDEILQSVCQVLWLNLRESDVLCRLAGDRFVALLPETTESEARSIATELQTAVSSLAYKHRETRQRIFLSATTAVTMACEGDADTLIRRLSRKLTQQSAPAPKPVSSR